MFYDNLKEICNNKNLKISPTVTECGGKVGSIGGWKKGAYPNSEIVIKLANRLNVTTDELLLGKIPQTLDSSENEQRLLTAFRKLNEAGQRNVLGIAELSAESPQYQKYTNIPKEA